MQDVSDKLLGQFTACLEKKVGDSSAATVAANEAAAARTTTAPEPEPPTPVPTPSPTLREVRAESPQPEVTPRGHDEALDLGATVLPVIAKAYWKQVAGGLLALVLLRRLLSRRH
jgi:hypothetical protein